MSHLGWLTTTYKIDGHEMNFNSNQILASLIYRPITIMEQTKFQVFWLLRIKLQSDCGMLEFEVNATNISSELGRERGLEIWMFSSVQLLSRVRLSATPWITAHQASLSITNSQSSLRLTSIESVMPFSHLILRRPLLLLPLIPPSIRVFSNESTLRMRWPKYWSFSNRHSAAPPRKDSLSCITSCGSTLGVCVFLWGIFFKSPFSFFLTFSDWL